jgi:hypothetical protein
VGMGYHAGFDGVKEGAEGERGPSGR